MKTLRFLLASMLLSQNFVFAQTSEPAAVKQIRSFVQAINRSLSTFKEVVTDEGCEGDGCGKSTVWLDPQNRIRKIVRTASGGPADGSSSGDQLNESYYDHQGMLIFEFSRNKTTRNGQTSLKEERYYVQSKKLIADGGPIGRKLDFLAQELNRESNTLCSKANDLELTNIGLDLKAVVEQFREQVQNLE